MQLQIIEIDKTSEEHIQEPYDKNEDDEDSLGCLHVSIHAIEGEVGTNSMRLQVHVGRKPAQILIDNGIILDFLDYDLTKKLG